MEFQEELEANHSHAFHCQHLVNHPFRSSQTWLIQLILSLIYLVRPGRQICYPIRSERCRGSSRTDPIPSSHPSPLRTSSTAGRAQISSHPSPLRSSSTAGRAPISPEYSSIPTAIPSISDSSVPSLPHRSDPGYSSEEND